MVSMSTVLPRNHHAIAYMVRSRLPSRTISIKATIEPPAEMSSFIRKVPIPDIDGIERKVNLLDINANSQDNDSIPIVILPGTAQTINTFQPHFTLSKSSRLIIPELRCQGTSTDLLSYKGDIAQHVLDLELLLKRMSIPKIKLAGFSFGGRVAIALAAHKPHLVERLSLTCVPLNRPVLGTTILSSWKEALEEGCMRQAAWSFVFNGYSDRFLARYASRLPTFVDIISQSNDVQKLHVLLRDSHISNNDDQMSVAYCASRISCPVQVIAATSDRIAGTEPVKDLWKAIKNASYEEISTGHVACFEDPVRWRSLVSKFFSLLS